MTLAEELKEKMGQLAGLRIAVSVFCMALTLCAPPVAAASSPIPKYAQRIAGGHAGLGRSWSIWVFGHHRTDQCWATKTVEGGSSNEDALCGFDVPARPWQLAAKGTFGSGQDQESMLFFLTRESVVSLKVLVEKGYNHQAWIHLSTHHFTSQAAKSAQININFSYAVGTISGPLTCVGRVIATTQSGKKISGSESSSCAVYPRS
jgi:hypothetical protein